jgi:D-cysteine desulfhydrase
LALGVAATEIASQVTAIAVCDSRAYFETVTRQIIAEARALEPSLPSAAPLVLEDEYIGPGYGLMSDEQKAFLIEVAQRTGLVLDPVYSGKALFALAQLKSKPRNVLFIHTGGLPGLLAQADDFAPLLPGSRRSE